MRTVPTILALTATGLLLGWGAANAAPKPDPWPKWQAHDAASTQRVDHAAWDRFLQNYLVTDHADRIYRVRYGEVVAADANALRGYVAELQKVRVSGLNRAEQRAYWINLYNALTVQEILDHYPVSSIRKIKSGFFKSGPWDKQLLTIEGEQLTLNDIEHRILRPLWNDNRVHYAVNCASLGCPNLQPQAYTADNTEELLERGARQYVNHPRGARFENGQLHASSIYDWFQVDFGGSDAGVVAHLLQYAEGELAEHLRGYRGDLEYTYDWGLNE